jgi:hypothetical protein
MPGPEQRLVGLAKLAIEVLDAEREQTGVDEWDESDLRCYLYNAAYAVIEGRPEDADEELGLPDALTDQQPDG